MRSGCGVGGRNRVERVRGGAEGWLRAVVVWRRWRGLGGCFGSRHQEDKKDGNLEVARLDGIVS